MKILYNFFLLLWTFWCFISFVIVSGFSIPILLVLLSFKSHKLYIITHKVPNLMSKIILFLWRVKIDIYGLENIESQKQYIFVGNHRSMLDPLVLSASLNVGMKYIGKEEIKKWPIVGFIMRKLYIAVDRNDENSRLNCRKEIIDKAKEGISIAIFSEGKTNIDNNIDLLPFKSGAFYTSAICNIPIIPLVIYNANNVWYRKSILIKPGKVKISFLKAIETIENNEESIQNAKQKCFDIIIKEYKKSKINFK